MNSSNGDKRFCAIPRLRQTAGTRVQTCVNKHTLKVFEMVKKLRFYVLLMWLTASVSAVQGADEWKLEPLRYNQPDLVVELGVGLWAWPMPTDYDRDGDLDLLVACPDKPSNGVYFFENQTQNPKEKFPVFAAAVRLGAAVQNMQMSYVNGKPRILAPGREFLPSNANGQFDFTQSKTIYPKANIHSQRVRANMWRYVDFDGDQDQDLIVGVGDWTDYGWDQAYDAMGRWRNGPLHGYVYLIENLGTDDEPSYSDKPAMVTAGGGAIDVYEWPSPNFADFDGDGDLDLLCGEFLDGFTYFKNVGTRETPEYASGVRLQGPDQEPLQLHVQMITPTAIDWDSDGDLDLVVGDEDGRVALVEMIGLDGNFVPKFAPPKYFKQQADTLKFGALATPFVCDWDRDGDEDILCGNTAGNIAWFENVGVAGNDIRWNPPKLLQVSDSEGDAPVDFRVLAGTNGSVQGPCEAKWGYTTLSAADLDEDDDLDIVYNSIHGRLGILRQHPWGLQQEVFDSGLLEHPPGFRWWDTQSGDTLTQWRTTPVAADFDKDGDLDLVMLDQEGFLTLRSGMQSAKRCFTTLSGEPLRLNAATAGRSGRVKLAIVDWDMDGLNDVLVNSENARWYRNLGQRAGNIVLKQIGNLARRNVAGHTSSPAVCDFNQDGKPDLLVGAENGRLYFIEHDECIQYDDLGSLPTEPQSTEPMRFPGLVSENFIFQKAGFAQCHASTICETTRGLVAAWFGGTKEGASDVGIWTSFHDGARWSNPVRVAEGVQHEGLRYPCWNPVLFQPPGDSPLMLFFKVGPNPREWWGEVMISYDRGKTFRARRRLPEGILGPVRCKPLLTQDGAGLLCGSSTEHEGWRVHFESVSLTNGLLAGPWKRIGPINDASEFNAIQPTLLRHSDGRLQALCRTKEGVIASTESRDEGITWSALTSTNLPNPNSGIDVVNLRDGRFLLVYNHLTSGDSGWGRRGMLNLAVSEDGVRWNRVAVLEQQQGGEFSYPAIVQSDDGLIHITYTWNRTRIKHVVVDPQAIRVGELLSMDAWGE